MVRCELYGTRGCSATAELREDLEWRGVSFIEYDVERDAAARARLRQLAPGVAMVPVLVEDGEVTTIGWHGRGCFVDLARGQD